MKINILLFDKFETLAHSDLQKFLEKCRNLNLTIFQLKAEL